MKNFELLRYLKKWWFLIMVVTAAGCLLVYQFVSSNQQYTATAVIQYTNVNASAGLNADGTELDPSEITSAAVINRTIEDLGLTSSTESIRSRVSVQEVIPEDEETRKETALKNGEEYHYHPTVYQVSFAVDDQNAADYARKVLDALLSNYFNYYGERHVDSDLFPNNAVNVSVDNYEYIDCVEMLRVNANDSTVYLNRKAGEKYGFYSVQTGYSFSDLVYSYRFLENNSLNDLYAFIINHALVKDRDVLIDKKQNEVLQYQLQIDSLNKNIAEVKALIDQFGDKTLDGTAVSSNASDEDSSKAQIITDIAAGWDSKTIEASRDVTTTYDKLIQHYADLQAQLIEVTNQKGQANEILSIYQDVTANTPADSEEAQWAATRIKELADSFTELYQTAIATINEYNEVIGADNIAMKCSVVVSEKLNLKLYQMLAMVLFLIVGCFLAIFLGRLGDFIDYFLYVDKKTGLPNRERCDDRIEHYGEGKLQDRFSFISLTLELSELDRNDGDWALQIVGETLQRVFRSIAFVGYNGAGQFMIMMENSTEDFTASCIERFLQVLKRSELPGLEAHVHVGMANSTADDVYEIRALLRMALRRCAQAHEQGSVTVAQKPTQQIASAE